jgi:HK97 family phage major capsid protein
MAVSNKQIGDEIQAIWERVDSEYRSPTQEERYRLDDLLHRYEQQKAVEAIEYAFGNGGGSGIHFNDPNAQWAHGGPTPGEKLIQSAGWKAIANAASRGRNWTTGPIDLGPIAEFKAGTIFESGQGAGLVPVPQVIPGVVTQLLQPLGVADLFAQGVADTSSVRYVVEGTATSAAAGVLEGGTKPTSDLALSTVDEPVRKIATVIGPVSDEVLDDSSAFQAYVNSRLSLFVRIEQDRQLLRGTASPELVGLVSRSPNLYARAAADDNTTAIAKALSNTAGSSWLDPDYICMHRTNWLACRLLRDGTGGTAGQYLGSGPFGLTYGNASAPGLGAQTLWGVPVFLTNTVGVGTAILGSFKQGAQVFNRGGLTVELSNSGYVGGKDLFSSDQVMIRCELRMALACYRNTSFTVVSNLTS